MVSKMLDLAFPRISEWILENSISIDCIVMIHAVSSIVLENVCVSSTSIALVIESSWFFLWCLLNFSWHSTIILLQMNSCMTHMLLVWMVQSPVIQNYLLVSSWTISEITDMFRVKGSLHACKSLIHLGFIDVIHFLK